MAEARIIVGQVRVLFASLIGGLLMLAAWCYWDYLAVRSGAGQPAQDVWAFAIICLCVLITAGVAYWIQPAPTRSSSLTVAALIGACVLAWLGIATIGLWWHVKIGGHL